MTAAELRAALARPGLFDALPQTFSDDAEGLSETGIKPAAVLVAVILHAGVPGILLTHRAAHLSTHAGQVSFPGGRMEPGETPEAAALREAAEEVGLDPRLPEIAGRMPRHRTGTGYVITPVVASVEPGFRLTCDPREVASAFELPVRVLLDPNAPRRESTIWKGQRREYWTWPHGEHRIWGATAAILVGLAQTLRRTGALRGS
ncbi:MAG TPA: CoA pyrophosphatase [Roseococcus sp.]|jgi:8-oxo-dGTP pyrophosphatase MutT (NUDIX family)|nr:CoA pyrophosphatase [Roseococcus sp.]